MNDNIPETYAELTNFYLGEDRELDPDDNEEGD